MQTKYGVLANGNLTTVYIAPNGDRRDDIGRPYSGPEFDSWNEAERYQDYLERLSSLELPSVLDFTE